MKDFTAFFLNKVHRKAVTIFTFFLCVIVVIGVVTYVETNKMNHAVLVEMERLRDSAVSRSTAAMNALGEELIRQKAQSVAAQANVFIRAHPEMTVADFQADSTFQRIAVQLVGKTGYTALTDVDTLTCRFHSQSNIVNLKLETLAKKLPGFWGIMSKTQGGKIAEGYYDWQDPDGTIRPKYMSFAIVDARTADGVKFSVAATTYIDEFSGPMKAIAAELSTTTEATKTKVQNVLVMMYALYLVIFVAIILFLAAIYAFVRTQISRPIEGLSRVTKEVSEGNLDRTIAVTSRDEIGQLAAAFNIMTEKLRASYHDLEGKVRERTNELEVKSSELNNKLEELQKFQRVAVGRELKMIELKKELDTLKKKLDKPRAL